MCLVKSQEDEQQKHERYAQAQTGEHQCERVTEKDTNERAVMNGRDARNDHQAHHLQAHQLIRSEINKASTISAMRMIAARLTQ
jgi:hypothetical protein